MDTERVSGCRIIAVRFRHGPHTSERWRNTTSTHVAERMGSGDEVTLLTPVSSSWCALSLQTLCAPHGLIPSSETVNRMNRFFKQTELAEEVCWSHARGWGVSPPGRKWRGCRCGPPYMRTREVRVPASEDCSPKGAFPGIGQRYRKRRA